MEQATNERGTGTMQTIETTNGRITIERIETGAFWYLAESDNGQHPNSPYLETFEHEDGPFESASQAESEAFYFLNNEDWRF